VTVTRTRAHDLALALRHYLSGEEDAARLRAYEVGRDAMAGGGRLLEIVADHEEALAILLSDARRPEDSLRALNASAALLEESLSSFEMAHRGFQEANETLVRVNQDLERQIAERQTAEASAREAREQAERANTAKSQFLSRMSHELRTPLNSILGFAQLLEMDSLTSDQEESVTHILKGGRHLLQLINEVLDIARIEEGRLSLSLEPVAVAEVTSEAMDLIRPMAADRRVSVSSNSAAFQGLHVTADRQRLVQVLLNLLSNAVKYNREEGSVSLRWEERPDRLVRLEVTDTGRGIPSGRIDKLFSPFERLGAESSGIQGTGLGLSLSKRLVDAMGGALGVRSTEGLGSTFWLELDASASPSDGAGGGEDDSVSGRQRGLPTAGPAFEHRSVLYVEDNLSNATLVERVLAHLEGVKLLLSMQGGLALDLARQHAPDLILLDLHLPDMEGHEVLARLREDPQTRAIPVVVMSADATPGQIERLLSAGARAYLTKPIDVPRMLGIVEEILSGGADGHA
jgi:signal transduction histidine kinase/ActR/RegA family two-component response regulator